MVCMVQRYFYSFNTAMDILENIGIEFLNEESRTIFLKAGCKIDGTNVKMDREWVMEMIGQAPSQFTICLLYTSPSPRD